MWTLPLGGREHQGNRSTGSRRTKSGSINELNMELSRLSRLSPNRSVRRLFALYSSSSWLRRTFTTPTVRTASLRPHGPLWGRMARALSFGTSAMRRCVDNLRQSRGRAGAPDRFRHASQGVFNRLLGQISDAEEEEHVARCAHSALVVAQRRSGAWTGIL
jgi:hypothetical protein